MPVLSGAATINVDTGEITRENNYRFIFNFIYNDSITTPAGTGVKLMAKTEYITTKQRRPGGPGIQ